MMHLSLFRSVKKRMEEIFLGDSVKKSTPENEIEEKEEPSRGSSGKGMRHIREDNEIIKIDKKIINELSKLIKNTEGEFLGFDVRKAIKDIEKGGKFAQRLRESYI